MHLRELASSVDLQLGFIIGGELNKAMPVLHTAVEYFKEDII